MAELFCYQNYCLNTWHLWILFMIIIGPLKGYISKFFFRGKSTPPPSLSVDKRTSTLEPVPKVINKAHNKGKPLPVPPVTGNVYKIDNPRHLRKLQDMAIDQNKSIVVYFTAPWCGPCLRMFPFYEAMAEIYDAIFTVSDVTVYKEFHKEHDVTYVPTYMVLSYENEEWVIQDVGAGATSRSLNEMVLNLIPKKESEKDIIEQEYF